jgi:septal ring factor EnvC (AmiA/AmiB activator)
MGRVLYFPQTIYQIIITCLVFHLSFGIQSTAWSASYGIVLSNRLNIRPSADLTQEPLGVLYKGMRVLVIEKQEDWLKIKHLGKIGFVSSQFIEIIGFEPARGEIIADRLNLRPTSDQTLPPIGKLYSGTIVQVISADKNWLFIRHHNQIGYVARKFVRIMPKKGVSQLIHANQIQQSEKRQEKVQALKEEKNEIKQQISAHQKQYRMASEKEKDILVELDEVDRSLNQYVLKLSALSKEIESIDRKIGDTRTKSESLLKQIAKTEKYVSKRLVALYKLKRIGASQIFYHADSFSDVFASYKYLSYILNHDNQTRSNLMTDKKHLEHLFKELRHKRQKKKDMQDRVSDIHAHMQRQKQERSNILKDIQNQKHLAQKAMLALKESASNLDQTINDLRDKISKTKQRDVLFDKKHPKLRLPVNGKIVNQYGTYTNEKLGITRFRSGLYIIAEKGEPIKAVCPGRILYAKWFKGYGNMIIIDHGDNYYTVYAHADEIFKHKGDLVEQGEVVGTLGDTGSMVGPGLYFEVRHHGKPINPIKWLKES